MKNFTQVTIFLLVTFGMSACMDTFTEEFRANAPVYMSYEELRASVKASEPRSLEKPGKIYFKDNFIFVVEDRTGIHIIDVSDPSNPVNSYFIEVPGCVDVAIKQNVLYVDSYVDLVAIDLSDLNNIREVARVKDVLPYIVPPVNNDYRMAEVDQERGVVIDWEVKTVRKELEYQYYPVYPMWNDKLSGNYTLDFSSGVGGASGASTVGTGGSMARFGLYDDYLYAIDNAICYMFDVSNPSVPFFAGKESVGWGVETMFIYEDHMFLGTTSGMIILSLEVPLKPTYIANFWHITACDPVVVSNGYAYVTLRGGNACGGTANRLDVIQLGEGYTTNTLVGSYIMENPHGLGIDGDVLFVCDGDAGLKVYNTFDKTRINQNLISSFPYINAKDVIPVNGYLFMVGEYGFYFYDYSNIQDIKLVGRVIVG